MNTPTETMRTEGRCAHCGGRVALEADAHCPVEIRDMLARAVCCEKCARMADAVRVAVNREEEF